MEFNEVINKRRTSREWTDREVDFDVIKRIIGAGRHRPGITTGTGSLLYSIRRKKRKMPLDMQNTLQKNLIRAGTKTGS